MRSSVHQPPPAPVFRSPSRTGGAVGSPAPVAASPPPAASVKYGSSVGPSNPAAVSSPSFAAQAVAASAGNILSAQPPTGSPAARGNYPYQSRNTVRSSYEFPKRSAAGSRLGNSPPSSSPSPASGVGGLVLTRSFDGLSFAANSPGGSPGAGGVVRSPSPTRTFPPIGNGAAIPSSFASPSASPCGPHEIGRPVVVARDRPSATSASAGSSAGFLSFVPDEQAINVRGLSMTLNSCYEVLYMNSPAKYVVEPDPMHSHPNDALAAFKVRQGQQVTQRLSTSSGRRHIIPLLNGHYLLLNAADASALLFKRMVTIVFDLDNTLVHSVETDSPELYMRGVDVHHLRFREPNEMDESHVVSKVRPGCREVLKSLSEKFDLYICTMGTKSYVTEAMKVLDPQGNIFKHCICREDLPTLPEDPNVLVKDLYRIEKLNDPAFSVVVDDSPDVWIQKKHVVPISKYAYFQEDYVADSYRNAVPSLYSVRVLVEGIARQLIFAEKPWEVSIASMLEKYHR